MATFNPMAFDMGRGEEARIQAEDKRAVEKARQTALREYHERFRDQLLRLLDDHATKLFIEAHKPRAAAPKTFRDLWRLNEALARLVSGPRSVLEDRLRKAESSTLVLTAHKSLNRSWADAFATLGESYAANHKATEVDLRNQLYRDIDNA